MTEPIVLARAIHLAATVLAAGTVAFTVLVAEPAFSRARPLAAFRRRMNILTWLALAVAVASGATWLALLAADIYGAPVIAVCLHGGLWAVLTGTQFGAAWSARLLVAVLLALLLLLSPALRWLQLAAAAAFIAPIALSGHAGATPGAEGEVHLASDMLHLAAAGLWLGALPALAMLLVSPRQPKGLAARAAARFSAAGIVAVAVILATGIVNSWMLLAGPYDLIATSYGRLLFLKIGLFVAMVGIAAVNRFHLTPRLPAAQARRALMRNSLAETALGAGVLLLVGALGAMSPTAHKHFETADVPADAAFVHIHTEEAMAEVTIEPGRPGPAAASIRVMHEDSSQYATNDVRLELEPPSPAFPLVRRSAVLQSDGTWRVDGLNLPQPGNWTVRVTIAPEKGKPIVLDAPIVIEPPNR